MYPVHSSVLGALGASMGSPTEPEGAFGRLHKPDAPQPVKRSAQASGQPSVENPPLALISPPSRKTKTSKDSKTKAALKEQGDFFPICGELSPVSSVSSASSFVRPASLKAAPVNTCAELEGMTALSPPSEASLSLSTSRTSLGSASIAPARRAVMSDRGPRRGAHLLRSYEHPPTSDPVGLQQGTRPSSFLGASAPSGLAGAIPLLRMAYAAPVKQPCAVPPAPLVACGHDNEAPGAPVHTGGHHDTHGVGLVSLSLESDDSEGDMYTMAAVAGSSGPEGPGLCTTPTPTPSPSPSHCQPISPCTPSTPNPTQLQATPLRPGPLGEALASMQAAVSMVGLGVGGSVPAVEVGGQGPRCDCEAATNALWLEHRVRRLEGLLRGKDEQISRMQSLLQSSESTCAAAQSEAKHSTTQLQDQEKQVQALQTQVCGLQTRLADSRSKLQTRESEQSSLKSACSEAQARAVDAQARVTHLEGSLSQAEDRLRAVQRELKAQGEGSLELVRKHSEALCKLGQAESRIVALEGECQAHQAFLSALQASTGDLTAQLQQREQRLLQAEEEIQALRVECGELQGYKARSESAEAQCDVLEALVTSLRAACAHAQETIHARDETIEAKEAALKEHVATLSLLREEIGVLSSANAVAESSLVACEGRAQAYTRQVAGRVQDAVTANLHLQRAALVLQAMVGQGSKLAAMWSTLLDLQLKGEDVGRQYPYARGNRMHTLTLTLPTPLCLVPGQSTLISLAKPLGLDADYVRGSWPSPSTPTSLLPAYDHALPSLLQDACGRRGKEEDYPVLSYFALVQGVAPSSVSAQLGLQPGDLLMHPTLLVRGKYLQPACLKSTSLLPLEGQGEGGQRQCIYLWRPDMSSNTLGVPLHLPSSYPDAVIITTVEVSFTVSPYGGTLLQQARAHGAGSGSGTDRMQMLALPGPDMQLAPRWAHGPVPDRPL